MEALLELTRRTLATFPNGTQVRETDGTFAITAAAFATVEKADDVDVIIIYGASQKVTVSHVGNRGRPWRFIQLQMTIA